ncbi:MAG TPA: hypothetical protein VFB27_06255 [Opitutaceae bacterium]|nr:hypothetical protein [Opitutaceae bacterium]
MVKLSVPVAVVWILFCAVAPACKRGSPPAPDDAFLSVYQAQEEAIRLGDGARWLSFQTETVPDGVTKAQIDAMRTAIVKNFHPRPGLHETVAASRMSGDRAALVARVEGLSNAVQYETVRFSRENGAWKISEEDWSDSPIDPSTLDVLLPPADGAFGRAHSPWTGIATAEGNTRFFKPEELTWKMQAVQDEGYLYIRFEAAAPLPAAGTEMAKNDSVGSFPPTMKIRVRSASGGQTTDGKEFELQAGPVVQTRATFDDSGHASNRFFVIYSLTLRDGAHTDIFTMDTHDAFNQLVTVKDRCLDLKIPLTVLAPAEKRPAEIEIEEVNSLAKILPYQVGSFSQ